MFTLSGMHLTWQQRNSVSDLSLGGSLKCIHRLMYFSREWSVGRFLLVNLFSWLKMTNHIVFWRTLLVINLSHRKQESQFTLATEIVQRIQTLHIAMHMCWLSMEREYKISAVTFCLGISEDKPLIFKAYRICS